MSKYAHTEEELSSVLGRIQLEQRIKISSKEGKKCQSEMCAGFISPPVATGDPG